jgi:hypothetical protein
MTAICKSHRTRGIFLNVQRKQESYKRKGCAEQEPADAAKRMLAQPRPAVAYRRWHIHDSADQFRAFEIGHRLPAAQKPRGNPMPLTAFSLMLTPQNLSRLARAARPDHRRLSQRRRRRGSALNSGGLAGCSRAGAAAAEAPFLSSIYSGTRTAGASSETGRVSWSPRLESVRMGSASGEFGAENAAQDGDVLGEVAVLNEPGCSRAMAGRRPSRIERGRPRRDSRR